MRAARSKGYYSKSEGNKLIVRDTENNTGVHVACTLDSLDKLPPDLNPAKLFTVCKNNVTCYYTLFSPHSSFAKCEFTEDGYTYTSLEQYIVRRNALIVNDSVLARRVMGIDDPATIKSLSKGKFDSIDLDTKQNTVKKGMLLKYSQNDDLLELLKDTGTTVLAESNPFDKTWGTGLRITDANAHSQQWEGQNLHGKLLEEVRAELSGDWD